MILRNVLGMLSPAGSRARLSTLIFHRVLPERDELFPGEVTAEEFDEICRWLAGWFNPLPLREGVRRLVEGTLPSRALAITFDDGYADNHDLAMPILRRHGLSATFFVATGFLDGGRMWNDTVIESVRRCTRPALDLRGTSAASLGELPLGNIAERQRAIARIIGATKYLPPLERDGWVSAVAERCGCVLPDDLMMRSWQVRGLCEGGMDVGAHTVWHPILAGLGSQEARREIDDGRRQLKEISGRNVALFAYPNGRPGFDYGPAAVDIVKDLGFDAAVSTAWGSARQASDIFQLPRFTPWDRTQVRFGMRMARNLISG